MKKVILIFNTFDPLHHLIGVDDMSIECDLIYEPQDTGDMFAFEYEGRKFKVNPQYSGFVGIVYL